MIYAVLAVFGLIFGSFVNALIWRLHEQAELQEQREEGRGQSGREKASKSKAAASSALSAQDLSMWRGRSMCSHCHHELAAKDLIPLFSWLWLRGRCRYCGVQIQDNPLVEVAAAVLFVLSYACWPLALHGVGLFQFVAWLVFVVAFVALATYDLRWLLLPNRLVFPLIGLAILQVAIVTVINRDSHDLWGPLLGAFILSGLFYLLFTVSAGNWIGGGDVKLAIVLGLLAGTPAKALLLLFFASIIGTVFSIPLIIRGRKGLKAQVPFGPFLIIATVLTVLFGQAIINWYSHLLLPSYSL